VSVRPRSLAFLVGAAALAGCGGGSGDAGPRLARADAAPLIALAHRIGHEGACAQARDIRELGSRAIALVNAQKVPAELTESLMSGVNALAEQTPPCVPPVKPAPPQPTPPPAKHHGHDDHGKHRGEGDE
jgi:hypothetical protein